MIIVMQQGATAEQVEAVIARLQKSGFEIHLSRGVERTIIGIIGDRTRLGDMALEAMPGVEKVMPVVQPYKLASRAFHPEDSVIMVGDLAIGGQDIHVMAGPCAVESREQLL
ncbi:MAG: 3-deoxy-7-phosphoheptulonate synthase, partial [Desulfofundulus sp.]